MADIIKIEILEDGTIKTTTDPISGPNHQSAESFMRTITSLAGGAVSRIKRALTHAHAHVHGHVHTHGDGE